MVKTLNQVKMVKISSARSVVPCIPGLPSKHLSSMMTALVQMFYLTILVAVIPRLQDVITIKM